MVAKKKSAKSKDLKPRAVKPGKAATVKGGGVLKDGSITKHVDKASPNPLLI